MHRGGRGASKVFLGEQHMHGEYGKRMHLDHSLCFIHCAQQQARELWTLFLPSTPPHSPLIPSVDDDVAGLHVLHELIHGLVDGGAGLHQNDDTPVRGGRAPALMLGCMEGRGKQCRDAGGMRAQMDSVPDMWVGIQGSAGQGRGQAGRGGGRQKWGQG